MAGPSASERAYRHVKERVLDGALPGGELISEGEIAEALGDEPHAGARGVRRSSSPRACCGSIPSAARSSCRSRPQETEAVMETRWVIERYAIERAIERPGDVPASCAPPSTRQAGLEGSEFVEADRAFHRALVAGTGNAILLTLYDSLRDRQRRMGRATARTPDRARAILGEHRELADAHRRRRRPSAR